MKAHCGRPEMEAHCELCLKWCTREHLASGKHKRNLAWYQDVKQRLGAGAAAAAAADVAVDEDAQLRQALLRQAFDKGFEKGSHK
jgi:hypothetical protein